MSAGRFRWSAFVIFEKPIPRISANASKSWVNEVHGIELDASANEASGWIFRRARSIPRRRSRIAAISALDIRAPPRFASLRSVSSNDAGPEAATWTS
jgi:hypothetical protein